MYKYLPMKIVLLICSSMTCVADTIIWKGDVDALGTPTPMVKLVLGKKYQIKVSGTLSLGNWFKNGSKVKNDACYEFNESSQPHLVSCFKNSLSQTVCDGKFHANHIYTSNQFIAAQSAVHFWIYDTNYEDNSGSLSVELYQIE
jgi:hypothetical protein